METKITQVAQTAQTARYLAIAGALILVVAAFLPWIAVEGFPKVNGINGDGVITLGIGVLVLIFLFIKKIPLWVSAILGAISGAIGIYDTYNAATSLGELQDLLKNNFLDPITNGNIGIGLYLTIFASALVVFGSLIQWIKNTKNSPS